ncbi:hypothetical protein [Sporosarcina sp. ITBMC105]
MNQSISNEVILQAITELSYLVKENQSDLKELRTVVESNHLEVMGRIDTVEDHLSEKIRKVDGKVTILSNELLETKADVLRLQQARY